MYAAAFAAWECVASGDAFAVLVVYVPAAFVAREAVAVGGVADVRNNTLFISVCNIMCVVRAIVGAKICEVLHNF